jgi:hypothetical protein
LRYNNWLLQQQHVTSKILRNNSIQCHREPWQSHPHPESNSQIELIVLSTADLLAFYSAGAA